METYDAYTLVKHFQQLQEERIHTYHIFNEGHKLYLESGPNYEFVRFRQLVHEITQEFKRISEAILETERLLRMCNQDTLANLMASVQNEEKNKLELTACLQLAKQGCKDHSDEPEREVEVLMLKQRLNKVIEHINCRLEELRYEAADL